MSRYFTDSEVDKLDQRLVDKLDRARNLSGMPFLITSGYRTPDENIQAGGLQDSAHCSGLAVDLRCSDGIQRYKILSALLDVGFKRIGCYDRHIHVDLDETKPQYVIWTGESK